MLMKFVGISRRIAENYKHFGYFMKIQNCKKNAQKIMKMLEISGIGENFILPFISSILSLQDMLAYW